MDDDAPRLLVVAHGTASEAGRLTLGRLLDAVAAARPQTPVELCFLDVIAPTLAECLDERPTIVVPALLSTGYHVQTDIPAAVAPYPATRVTRHLGPHRLLGDVMTTRLGAGPNGFVASSTVLVAAGSSRPQAAAELEEVATDLARRFDHEVTVVTMSDDLDAVFAGRQPGFQVATYLLCEGQFVDRLVRAVNGPRAPRDRGAVAGPLGVHPALVELIWLRYDQAAGSPAPVR